MANIIVVFPKTEDAKNIRNILNRNGFHVIAVCTTGAQALNCIEELNDGIVVCGYRFADMRYGELHEYLPEGFEMLLIASERYWGEAAVDMCISMPLKIHDLVDTLTMMEETQLRRRRRRRAQPRVRDEKAQAVIAGAKEVLMERNNMTESEAHRYIQKCSMDSGTNMVETAHMILDIMKP
ncbi:MAG: ANTAR domain-containing protein [Lachnospiraceae bacterium]|nr:ANTAR domain-containing protein [Lachnospiraceae bacterium]MCI9068797.1 ANTAR domain-containing protein [Lachnospiraceae bacterium]